MEALREALRETLAGLRSGGGGGGGGGGAEDFDRARFREALAQAFQAASREATRLSLAAARAPLSGQAWERLSEGVRGAVVGAASVYYQLPQSQGKTLNNAVRRATVQVVEGTIQLIEVILRTPRQSLSQEQLISTGGLWEACDRVSCLPQDNPEAVALAISSCLELIRDALQEMEQMQAEGGRSPRDLLEDNELAFPGSGDLAWSDAERQLLGPCAGLVKATRAALRKVLGAVRAHGKADTEQQVAQLDDLADAAAELSPSVDELVLSLCPPVNRLALRLNAGKLASVLMKMLEVARTSHICPPSEENWVQFLAGAVDHNMGRVKGFTQGLLGDPGPAGEDHRAGEALGGPQLHFQRGMELGNGDFGSPGLQWWVGTRPPPPPPRSSILPHLLPPLLCIYLGQRNRGLVAVGGLPGGVDGGGSAFAHTMAPWGPDPREK